VCRGMITQPVPTVYLDRRIYTFKSARLNCDIPVEANSLESALFRARKTDQKLELDDLVEANKTHD